MSSTEWETPQDFFDTLNAEFHFTLDVCATAHNAKCERFFTKQHDGLDRDWSNDIVWVNPPYGNDTKKWLRKVWREAQKGGTGVVLIQARSSDTPMWHDYIMKASEIRYIKNRLHFTRADGFRARGNHAGILVVFRPYCQGAPVVSSIDTKGRLL